MMERIKSKGNVGKEKIMKKMHQEASTSAQNPENRPTKRLGRLITPPPDKHTPSQTWEEKIKEKDYAVSL